MWCAVVRGGELAFAEERCGASERLGGFDGFLVRAVLGHRRAVVD